MSSRPTARLVGYSVLVALGLLGSLVVGRVVLVALVAPFALWLLIGAALARTPTVSFQSEIDRRVALEGEEVQCAGEVVSDSAVAWLEVAVKLPSTFGSDPPGGRWRVSPRPGSREPLIWELTPREWGAFRLGELSLRATDPMGLFAFSEDGPAGEWMRVYPAWRRLREMVPPQRTQVFAGNRLARQQGEGIEFADVRPFVAGDRIRRINWRVTARAAQPYVNDFHLERNADVILFIDTFTALGVGRDSVLGLAVRAASALGDSYLRQRDRVGVVGFGGILRWLSPGMGSTQLYRIVESLLDAEVVPSYAWREVSTIPPRVLPPAALVIALSPLLDDRTAGALADLHRRGYDLTVIEVDPEQFLPPAPGTVSPEALRLWRLRRRLRREAFTSEGVVVVPWGREQPLDAALAAAREYRRFVRRVLV